MKPLAIIPARGGSKRIPRKNLEKIGNLRAIEHAVIKASNSGLFESVIISTDDSEIAEKAILHGAHFNSYRPLELSDDFATTLDVMAYEVNISEIIFPSAEYFCCIYPMTPLLDFSRVREGLDLIKNSQYEYVFSAKRSSENFNRALRLDADDKIEFINAKNETWRTQDLEQHYFDAGQFYWGHKKSWLEKKAILSGNSKMILFEKYEVIDVDDPSDLEFVRDLYSLRRLNQQDSEKDDNE